VRAREEDLSHAFGVFFALIPALLAELVNDYGPQIRHHHDAPL
jgi:hypothetical protein